MRVSHRKLKTACDRPCQIAFDSPKRLAEKADRTPILNLERRISDKVALCQLVGGFEIGMDICQRLR